MEVKKVTLDSGKYICDIDISVEEWKSILQDKTLMNDNYKDVLIKFHSEPNHKATCKELGIKYDASPQSFNGTITNFAKAVQKKLNRFVIIGTDGKPTYWIIVMLGKNVGEYFEWTIRPELAKAMDELKIYKSTNYWTFKHKPGTDGGLEAIKFVERAISLNSALMQYEYRLQEQGKVTQNWKRVKDIQEGDILFLRGDTNIYAVGQVIRPRKQPDIILSIDEIIKNKSHGKYLSGEYEGCIHFKDSEVFYEDLSEGKNEWGQRVDVNCWKFYDKNGIYAKGQANYMDGENEYGVIKKLKPEKAKSFLNQLKIRTMGSETILLESNKNLILTGAPGTGKTYLAKQIALKMIFGKDSEKFLTNEEKEVFKECCCFVQFHPSYDYSDFVEGLRPVKKENNELGFELRDGIFKSFCKKALKNLMDSQKSKEELQKQKTLSENLALFIEKINNEITEKETFILHGIGGKECAPIIEIDTNSFTTKSTSGNTLTTPLNSILTKYEVFSKHKDIDWSFKEVAEKLSVTYHHTYFFAFLKAFDSFIQENKVEIIDIDVVEKKNFVIIIDEINRAEISKVFGELFFAIDPGYRGIKGKVKTQYSNLQNDCDLFNDGFFIPENVYIIGTMNDIDRSVESFDFAMRRRFAWKEIKADERISMWDGEIDDYKEEALIRMKAINNKIDSIESLNASYHIGPAYFLKIKNYNGDFNALWNNHIEGVLIEYLRGLPDAKSLIEDLKSVYENVVEL